MLYFTKTSDHSIEWWPLWLNTHAHKQQRFKYTHSHSNIHKCTNMWIFTNLSNLWFLCRGCWFFILFLPFLFYVFSIISISIFILLNSFFYYLFISFIILKYTKAHNAQKHKLKYVCVHVWVFVGVFVCVYFW